MPRVSEMVNVCFFASNFVSRPVSAFLTLLSFTAGVDGVREEMRETVLASPLILWWRWPFPSAPRLSQRRSRR